MQFRLHLFSDVKNLDVNDLKTYHPNQLLRERNGYNNSKDCVYYIPDPHSLYRQQKLKIQIHRDQTAASLSLTVSQDTRGWGTSKTSCPMTVLKNAYTTGRLF